MGEKGIDRHQAMDTVRLQRLKDVCDTKENTAFFLLQEWNYEPQVRINTIPVKGKAIIPGADPAIPVSTVLRKSVKFFTINIFLVKNFKLSKLISGKWFEQSVNILSE